MAIQNGDVDWPIQVHVVGQIRATPETGGPLIHAQNANRLVPIRPCWWFWAIDKPEQNQISVLESDMLGHFCHNNTSPYCWTLWHTPYFIPIKLFVYISIHWFLGFASQVAIWLSKPHPEGTAKICTLACLRAPSLFLGPQGRAILMFDQNRRGFWGTNIEDFMRLRQLTWNIWGIGWVNMMRLGCVVNISKIRWCYELTYNWRPLLSPSLSSGVEWYKPFNLWLLDINDINLQLCHDVIWLMGS